MHEFRCRGKGWVSCNACSLFHDTSQLQLQMQLGLQLLDSMLTLWRSCSAVQHMG